MDTLVPSTSRNLPAGPTHRSAIGYFAAAGALAIAFQLYLYVRWVTSGSAGRVPSGPDDLPVWMDVSMRVAMVGALVALPVTIHLVVVRPWRREGHLSGDGLMLLALLTLFWQDLLLNYFHYIVVYNTAWPNLGSWYGFIPGWGPPAGNLQAEPLLFFLPLYGTAMFGGAVLGCKAMSAIKRRRPAYGAPRLLACCWIAMTIFDLGAELVITRFGWYTFPGAIPSLTIFYGEYYQFPIYEAVLGGFIFTGLAGIRFFKNDRGETLAERGMTRLKNTGRRRTAVRFLALVGACNLVMLTYNVAIMKLYTERPWPTEISSRSYFVNGLCTPESTYACPEEEPSGG